MSSESRQTVKCAYIAPDDSKVIMASQNSEQPKSSINATTASILTPLPASKSDADTVQSPETQESVPPPSVHGTAPSGGAESAFDSSASTPTYIEDDSFEGVEIDGALVENFCYRDDIRHARVNNHSFKKSKIKHAVVHSHCFNGNSVVVTGSGTKY